MVELVGENLAAATGLGFVALRIARVVGPGARNTASSWRSQAFEGAASPDRPLAIPFAPSAQLSLVHVDEVARMLMLLSEAADLPRQVYNSPVEVWEARELADLVRARRKVRVQMGEAPGGPICDGTLFTRDFAFRLRGLAEYLATNDNSTHS